MNSQTLHRTPRTGTDAIRDLAARDDRSLAWVARKLGISTTQMSRILSGERPLIAAHVASLAELFSVPAETFIESPHEDMHDVT